VLVWHSDEVYNVTERQTKYNHLLAS